MCYHSNKLNVHYLHYISLSRSTTSSLSGKKRKSNHPMNHHSKLDFLGQAYIKALHTETSTLPRLECGREIPMTEELAHMLRSGEVVVNPSPSESVTKSKTMAFKLVFQPNMHSPGLVLHRTELLSPITSHEATGLRHTVLIKKERCGDRLEDVGKGLVADQDKHHQIHQAWRTALANFYLPSLLRKE